MNELLDWGIPFIEWIQGLGQFLLAPMQFFSFLGTQWIYILIMPAIIWSIDVTWGIRVGMLVLSSGLLNGSFKLMLGFPRPYWVSDQIAALSPESSFGLPSGHAQNGVAMWGRLATGLKRRWATVAAIGIILFISISRLYLGVHFPTDVLIGWGIGIILLWLFIVLEKPVLGWLRGRRFGIQILASLLLPTALLTIGLVSVSLAQQRGVPETWVQNAQNAIADEEFIMPAMPDDVLAAGGGLLGFSLGAAFLLNWGKFTGRGTVMQRLQRYVVGVIGVVIIFFGLRAAFPDDHTTLANALRIVRYALTAFWASFLAPRAFVAMNMDS
jgi:membrane-associated phospholipid phosphatase